jgi:uncharacterized membrane protein
MADTIELDRPSGMPSALLRRGWFEQVLRRPVLVFVVLSAIFGTAVVFINPALRGPDEAQHFVRIYGIAKGEILPSTVDAKGRRGTFLPAQMNEDLHFFDAARARINETGFSYRTLLADFFARRDSRDASNAQGPLIFTPYAGSESYPPHVYAAPIVAALVGNLFGADFIVLMYAMRLAGLAFATALAAYAISLTPQLKWAFLLIAMLPSALNGRAILSADGCAFGFALIVAALCLRAALANADERIAERSFWMTLCVSSKPSQVAFVLLEGMTRSFKLLPLRWRSVALVVLPALLAVSLWMFSISAEVAAWRIVQADGGRAEEFSPLWKLGYMMQHPLHFPQALITSLDYTPELLRQLIGVLGWLDTALHPLAYPVLGITLVAVSLETLPASAAIRMRIAAVSWLTVIAYILAVFVIFYLIWTPVAAGRIEGVQGRYFLAALPLMAIGIACFVRTGFSPAWLGAAAIGGALISGVATLEALIRVNW